MIASGLGEGLNYVDLFSITNIFLFKHLWKFCLIYRRLHTLKPTNQEKKFYTNKTLMYRIDVYKTSIKYDTFNFGDQKNFNLINYSTIISDNPMYTLCIHVALCMLWNKFIYSKR